MINGMHHPVADWLFRAITQFGSGFVAGPLLITLVLVNIRREQFIRVILCGAIGLTLGGAVNSQVKHIVHRQRPAVYFAQQASGSTVSGKTQIVPTETRTVRLLGPAYRSRSFPSGHTNTAFAAAMFCSMLLGGWWFASFVLATCVGYSRIYLGVHFPLDAAAGALLGAGLMLIVMRVSGCLKNSFLKRKQHAR